MPNDPQPERVKYKLSGMADKDIPKGLPSLPDPQPAPAPARDFAEETAAKLIDRDDSGYVRFRNPDNEHDYVFCDWGTEVKVRVLRQYAVALVRAGLRHAADIARDIPQGYEGDAFSSACESIADAIDREAGVA